MEAQQTSRYDALTDKQASFEADNAAAKALANRRIWQMILGGAGLGLAGRGVMGLGELMRPHSRGYSPDPAAQRVDLMLPAPEEEEEKYAMLKTAEGWMDNLNPTAAIQKIREMVGGGGGDAATAGPSESIPLSLGALADPKYYAQLTKPLFDKDWGAAGNAFMGSEATSEFAVPAAGLGVPLGGLAAYAGYKGLDKLMDARRKAALESEEQSYKREYADILQQLQKTGSADDLLDEELDELAELYVEKQAAEKTAVAPAAPAPPQGSWVGKSGLGNVLGVPTNMALTYALVSSLLSGKVSYDYFKRRSEHSVAEEAMRRRSKERTGGVAPIQFSPGATKLV